MGYDPASRVGSALERKHPQPILYNNLRVLYPENDRVAGRINGSLISSRFETGYKLFLMIEFQHSVDDFP